MLTTRVKRLYVISSDHSVLCGILLYVDINVVQCDSSHRFGLFCCLCFVAVCGFIAWGPEKLISEYYFRSARRKLLAQSDLIRIGITGSYGKTSVKHILRNDSFGEKYSVFITPKSFNTPMGVVPHNTGTAAASHQVFIAEMGARHVGDIRGTVPSGQADNRDILTSVGPQHLETFKTVERVAGRQNTSSSKRCRSRRTELFRFDDRAISQAAV